MKKNLLLLSFVLLFGITSAQLNVVNYSLDQLEQNKRVNSNLENESLDNKKFVLIKDFEDHTERHFIILKGNKATFIEIFDDKTTGESHSNVFSGDVLRTRHNMISLRFDTLEREKLSVPVVKSLLLKKQQTHIYLTDMNTQERWFDENSMRMK